jgi:hypothetical protein
VKFHIFSLQLSGFQWAEKCFNIVGGNFVLAEQKLKPFENKSAYELQEYELQEHEFSDAGSFLML